MTPSDSRAPLKRPPRDQPHCPCPACTALRRKAAEARGVTLPPERPVQGALFPEAA